MGLKQSKKEGNRNFKGDDGVSDDGDSDDESEILEIMQETDYCENENQESVDGACRKCKKPHDGYILIDELKLCKNIDDCKCKIPLAIHHESVLEYIRLRAKLVVRIKVSQKSKDRPDHDKFAQYRGQKVSHVATGYAWVYCQDQTFTKCPDSECSEDKNQHNVFRGILITTNRHVIFDNEEAKKTKVKFFYDNDNKEASVLEGVGYALRDDEARKDYVSLKIYHHDDSLFATINKINEDIMKAWELIPSDYKLALASHAIVISHPHGGYKKISIGELVEKEVLERPGGRKVTKYTSATCEGSSGAPVLTGVYWTNPFVHSSARKRDMDSKEYFGLSFTY